MSELITRKSGHKRGHNKGIKKAAKAQRAMEAAERIAERLRLPDSKLIATARRFKGDVTVSPDQVKAYRADLSAEAERITARGTK